jgi:hypothetical protein
MPSLSNTCFIIFIMISLKIPESYRVLALRLVSVTCYPASSLLQLTLLSDMEHSKPPRGLMKRARDMVNVQGMLITPPHLVDVILKPSHD